ncbi:nuclease-related domain-containing protein [Virgibacillus sp. DJP39]|uniref:nuclease-related domain-containing protein n=1 Tax=Virgibacillus sp. DJP39 TaxID=3409790 RepID=UPI003BB68A60
MIIKQRTTPTEITKLEAVIPRLSMPQSNRLEKDLAYREKGYNGELKVDRYTAFLKDDFTILHDVYLHNKRSSFQIDSLIISPHSMYIIEIKDLSGTLLLNFNANQFLRTHNGIEESFRNPFIQATTNKLQLTDWLAHHKIVDIPIFPLVAIADQTTILKIIPEDFNITKTIMHGELIPHQITKIENGLEKGIKHPHRKIGAKILKECQIFDFDLHDEYGILPTNILGGVQCPSCGKLGMGRKYSRWNCGYCDHTSKDAHKKTLQDYLLLVKPWITNQECRQFLGLQSRNAATRILKAANLNYQNKRWVK